VGIQNRSAISTSLGAQFSECSSFCTTCGKDSSLLPSEATTSLEFRQLHPIFQFVLVMENDVSKCIGHGPSPKFAVLTVAYSCLVDALSAVIEVAGRGSACPTLVFLSEHDVTSGHLWSFIPEN
jgi:hypothetical protein